MQGKNKIKEKINRVTKKEEKNIHEDRKKILHKQMAQNVIVQAKEKT